MIRLATDDDANALGHLAQRAYGHYVPDIQPPPDPLTLDYRDVVRAGSTHVRCKDDQIVAMVTIGTGGKRQLILRNLAVHPDWRGHGLGREMALFVEERARQLGAQEVVLWTRAEMADNIRFYTRLGYHITHTDSSDVAPRVYFRKKIFPPEHQRIEVPTVITTGISDRIPDTELASTPHLKVERVGSTFAAEISQPQITAKSIHGHGREIYEAYLQHKVLVFRGQEISAATFADFGTIFGRPDQHHVVQLRHPDHPTLTYLSNQDEPGRTKESKTSGQGWHSDYSYKLVPGAATMLHGLEIPAGKGGDTLFADAESAYADLPSVDRERLRGLRVRHHYRWSPDRTDPWARWTYIGPEERKKTPPVSHPLVRVHPDTGRETLFLQPRVIGSVVGIEGFPTEESRTLIDDLLAHVTSPKYVYRHQWSPNDVVVWDNRNLLHSATTKDLDERHVRRLLRLTTAGSAVTPANAGLGHSRLAPAIEGDDG